jgi:hypothetical protein
VCPAAPASQVSGIAALYLQARPGASPADVRRAIVAAAIAKTFDPSSAAYLSSALANRWAPGAHSVQRLPAAADQHPQPQPVWPSSSASASCLPGSPGRQGHACLTPARLPMPVQAAWAGVTRASAAAYHHRSCTQTHARLPQPQAQHWSYTALVLHHMPMVHVLPLMMAVTPRTRKCLPGTDITRVWRGTAQHALRLLTAYHCLLPAHGPM